MRPTPEKMRAFMAQLSKKMNLKSLVITLSAIVVFTTTYLLVLPAFTLDKDEALEQGGIDIAVEQTVETVDEEAPAADVAEEKADEQKSADSIKEPEESAAKEEVKKETALPKQQDGKADGNEEVKLLNSKKELTAEKSKTDDFTVSAVVDKDAKVPEDVFLQATELTKDTEGFDYDKYYKDALNALKKDSDDVKGIKTIKFYDISLEAESQDESVEPEAAVNVKIAYDDGLKVNDADDIRIVHFAEQKNGKVEAQVLDNKENNVETIVNKESRLTEASFETDGFSVYAIVGTETITTEYISADGETYRIEVNIPAEAKIPHGSELKVEEISPESEEFADYLGQAMEAIGEDSDSEAATESVNVTEEEDVVDADDAQAEETAEEETEEDTLYKYIISEPVKQSARFFDISIICDGEEVEPEAPVEVKITYLGGLDYDKDEDVNIVHFTENGNVEVIEDIRVDDVKEGTAITYKQDSFSVTGTVTTDGIQTGTGYIIFGTEQRTGYTSGLALTYRRPAPQGLNEYVVANDTITIEGNIVTTPYNDVVWYFESLGNNRYRITDGHGNYLRFNNQNYLVTTNNTNDDWTTWTYNNNTLTANRYTNGTGGSRSVASLSGDINYVFLAEAQLQSGTTLHFVDDAGNPLTGIQYNGQTYDNDNSVDLADVLSGRNQTLNLTQFTKEGYTYSNTFITDYNGANHGDNIRNELRTSSNGTRQYGVYGDNDQNGNPNWRDINQIRDIYLVYSPNPGSGGGGGGGDDDAPELGEIGHSKEVTSNRDGTYNVELSVTGAAQGKQEDTDVNVIFVIDNSGSMYDNGRMTPTKTAVKNMASKLLENNTTSNPDAIELAMISFGLTSWEATFGENETTWTTNNTDFANVVDNWYWMNDHGDGVTRGTNWEAALSSVQNISNTDEDQTVVIFFTDGEATQYIGHNAGGQYLNAEMCYWAARDEAREIVNKGYILYDIFAYGSNDYYTRDYLGQLTNYAYNDENAKSRYYYQANNADAVEQALADILDTINMNFAYADVEINDGITGLTTVTFEDLEPESFTYTITYKDYTSVDPLTYETRTVPITVTGTGNNATIDIPVITYVTYDSGKGELKPITTKATTIKGATFAAATEDAPKSVDWVLEKTDGSVYMLEEAWTYTVDFKVWPCQASYDLVAALNNGLVRWGQDYIYTEPEDGTQVTIAYDDYKDQITGAPTGPFALKTNTSAGVKYQEYKAVLKPDGTVDHYEPVGTPTEKPITYTGSMPLDGIKMKLVKKWDTSLSTEDYADINSVTLYIMEDNLTGAGFNKNDPSTYYMAVPLTKANNWSAMVAIAPGIFDGNTFKTRGHTYTVLEPDIDSHYEFTMEPTHPMLDGETHDDETDMVEVYGEDGAPYTPMPRDGGTTTYSVTNTLKGGINIKKEIDVPEGLEQFVNPDQEFSFTINLVDASGKPVYTNDGVHDLSGTLGTRVYREDGTTDRGTIPNTGSVTLTMKASESIRIVNVPAGTSYTVTEYDLSSTVYTFEKSEWVVRHHPSIGSNDWVEDDSETITNSQTTNSHAIKPNAENNVTFTNKYVGTGFEATKIWDDNNNEGRPKTVTFQLYQKIAGSEDEPIAYGDPVTVGLNNDGEALEGTTVVDNDTWKYIWKGLPDKATVDGTAVTYEYSFKEELAPNYYTAVMSEDGKTVTNILAKKVRFVKEDMSGNPLDDAVFTLKLTEDITITSDIYNYGIMSTTDGISEFTLTVSDTPYVLTENTAPAGYNKLTGDVRVTVSQAGVTAGRSDDTTVNYTVDPPTNNDPVYTVHITNSAGTELPMTGGIGTTIFYILGSMLVIGCGIVLVSRRRIRNTK